MLSVLPLMVFGAVFFGILEARKIFQGEDIIEERLQRLMGSSLASELAARGQQAPVARRLKKKLQHLGLNRQSDYMAAVRLRRACYLIPLLSAGILFFMGFPAEQILLAGALFSVIFILLPNLILIRMAIARKREMEKHLPDTLDLLTLCLEAGLSFHSALMRVADEQQRLSSHLSRELKLTNQEMLAGKSQQEALTNLGNRTGIEEIQALVGTVIQSLKIGTSLVKALRTYATALRKKRREKCREKILKTPVKLIFPLLFFIFPTLLIVVLAPSLINIFRSLSQVGY